jgi:hypothetical protein
MRLPVPTPLTLPAPANRLPHTEHTEHTELKYLESIKVSHTLLSFSCRFCPWVADMAGGAGARPALALSDLIPAGPKVRGCFVFARIMWYYIRYFRFALALSDFIPAGPQVSMLL